MSVSASAFTSSESARTPRRARGRPLVVSARGGDHPAVFCFLTEVFQGPSRAEFKASLEDPFYEPRDRLLIKDGETITGHALITHRVMQFGPVKIPVAGLNWLGTSPSWRGQGLATHLLAAAEKQMLRDGALIGMLRTRVPVLFRHNGWALCGRQCYSQARARAVLRQLLDQGLRRQRFHIRPYRLWEDGALVRIYDQNCLGTYGWLERSDAYWHWLVHRRAYDQIYVAMAGPEPEDLEKATSRIAGYAVIRGEKMVELMTARGARRAAAELVARACGDAIEHDREAVTLHAPAADPLHKVFLAADGTHCCHESDHGEVYMARLLDPLKVLRGLCGELHRRAEEAGLSRPLELGLLVDGKKYQLELTREQTRAVSRRIGRSYFRLNVADFTRLVLGQLDWERAWAEGRIEASTGVARDVGPLLFPNVPFWRPPLDDMQG